MISYYLPSASKIGVGYQVDALARAMVERGHSVDVISNCPPVSGSPYAHVHVPLSGSLRTFRFALAVRGLDLSQYDVIHAHGDDYWLWRRRAPAHVRTLHGSCFEEALRVRGLKERARMVMLGGSELLATAVADQTVVVSPATRRWSPWVRTVVPNGVDLQRFRPRPELRSPHPVVLFVGTWHGRKRGRQLAQAFSSQVKPRVPSSELWMVTRDAPIDVGPGVKVLGSLSDDELVEAYQRAWVFALPSSYEGFGIPYVEAMACGLPVVATRNVGAEFVTDSGKAGVLTTLDLIGVHLAQLLEDAHQRESWGIAARSRATQFSLDTVVDAYIALYRQHLSGRASSAEAPSREHQLDPISTERVRPAESLAGLTRYVQDPTDAGGR